MNDVIGFDEGDSLQGHPAFETLGPLTIVLVLVLGFFAGSRPRTTTTSRIRKFPRLRL